METDHLKDPGIHEDDFKKDVQEVRCECMDWIDVAWDRNGWQALLNTVMNLQVPYSAGNYLTS